jgi:hypothetical protein
MGSIINTVEQLLATGPPQVPTFGTKGPYRPPQWGEALSLTTVMLIFPGQPQAASYRPQGVTATLPNTQTLYVFDAVLRMAHEQRVTKTRHPVQTGAAIADHAYVEPARLVLEIGMSDAMDAYQKGTWIGGATKSSSAYQVLLAMAFARIPLVVTTKLRTYLNMVIEYVGAEDTVHTIAGLRARIEFGEIFVANTQVVTDSSRPQDTGKTDLGSVNPAAPTAAQTSQNSITPAVLKTLAPLVPVASHAQGVYPLPPVVGFGWGYWSSVNTLNLPGVFAGLIPGPPM